MNVMSRDGDGFVFCSFAMIVTHPFHSSGHPNSGTSLACTELYPYNSKAREKGRFTPLPVLFSWPFQTFHGMMKPEGKEGMRPTLWRDLFRRLARHRMRFLFSFACLIGGRLVVRLTKGGTANRLMYHGSFYETAPRRTFIKCTDLFTVQCTKPVYGRFHDSMHAVVYRPMHEAVYAFRSKIHCTWSFTPICKNQCTRSFTTFFGFSWSSEIGRKEGKRAFYVAENPPGAAFYPVKS